jgi:hypothetical protein
MLWVGLFLLGVALVFGARAAGAVILLGFAVAAVVFVGIVLWIYRPQRPIEVVRSPERAAISIPPKPDVLCSRAGGTWGYRKVDGAWGAYCDVNGQAILYSDSYDADVRRATQKSQP